jgi:hypothetical protein
MSESPDRTHCGPIMTLAATKIASKIKEWTHRTHLASTLSYINDPLELFFRSTASTASKVADFLAISLAGCVRLTSTASARLGAKRRILQTLRS